MKLLADAAVAYRVILTKTDLVKPAALATLLQEVIAALKHKIGAHPEPIMTSAKDKAGVTELRTALAEYALTAPEPHTQK